MDTESSQMIQILERAIIGFVRVDADDRILDANRPLATLLETELRDLRGRQLGELTDAHNGGLLAARHAVHRAGGSEPFLVEWVLGTRRLCTVVTPAPRFDDEGTYLGYAALLTDVTSFNPGWEALRDATRRIEDLLERHANRAVRLQTALGVLLAGSESSDATQGSPEDQALAGLTPRERDVLAELIAGCEVDQIAASRKISPHTVRNHMKAIYRKIGVRSRMELITVLRSRPRREP